jgi:broad specificity phosphatase PhoE
MAQPIRIVYVRHGETDWNAEGRLQGQQEIPINATGRRQAAEAGRKLAALAISPATLPWLVSPMQRTRETAEIARTTLGLEPNSYLIEERLREISFGDWEGLTWKEVRRDHPEGARGRERDKWNFVPPAGESYAMLAERVRPWLDGLERDVIVVGHGGVARALLHLRCGVSPAQAPSVDIWQGKLLLLEGEAFRWI